MKANCVVCGKEFENHGDQTRKTCLALECVKERDHQRRCKYQATQKYRKTKRKYNAKPERRESNRKFKTTPKYRDYDRKRKATPEYRESDRKRNVVRSLGLLGFQIVLAKIVDRFNQQEKPQ